MAVTRLHLIFWLLIAVLEVPVADGYCYDSYDFYSFKYCEYGCCSNSCCTSALSGWAIALIVIGVLGAVSLFAGLGWYFCVRATYAGRLVRPANGIVVATSTNMAMSQQQSSWQSPPPAVPTYGPPNPGYAPGPPPYQPVQSKGPNPFSVPAPPAYSDPAYPPSTSYPGH